VTAVIITAVLLVLGLVAVVRADNCVSAAAVLSETPPCRPRMSSAW
jgi:hypothetical protein